MISFVILPHQLFDIKYLPDPKKYKIILWEHPQYFTKYKYNKKRIILHRSSMQYYKDHLLKKGFKVEYIEFNKKFNEKKYEMFDPIDKLKLLGCSTVRESPNFLLTKDLYTEYRKKTKNLFFNSFYMWGKKKINVIPDVKSQDKLNRSKLPKGIKIPAILDHCNDDTKIACNFCSKSQKRCFYDDLKYIKEAQKYVEKHFANLYGNVDNFVFPISHKSANKFVDQFIKNKLNNFGKYQDAIDKDNSFLFHSILSTSINIGLIDPLDLCCKIANVKTAMNNKEGFIRQLFWREYQRLCYIYGSYGKQNYFGNRGKVGKEWYSGSLGVDPVDDTIKKAFKNGYINHIERLMIMGNFMNLMRIDPKEGFRWFMEFSCDSYEWVMHQNVYDMAFFANENQSMRRPYLSSSNYILKMSNYARGEWVEKWDKLYNDFLKSCKKKLWKYRYYFRGLKDV
jgi:deoxyribodipyrimidine photolyase-related protein